MKKKYIFAALVLMMGLASCDNLLDLTPQSQISQTDYFKTESDLQLFSNTFYNNLLDKSPLMTKAIVCTANALQRDYRWKQPHRARIRRRLDVD